MTLRDKQSEFARAVGLLITYAYYMGYELTLGDAYATTGYKQNSFHGKRLAIDLNLFRDGNYLTETQDHLPLGEYWEQLGGTWGGRFNDGNHYELCKWKRDDN